jgi:CRP-like cAMP-binding protein
VPQESPTRLPGELLTVLRRICGVRNYASGIPLFSAEELPKGVYLIERGAVGLRMPVSPLSGNFDQTAGPGALLGLSETMTGEPHKFTAEALEDSQARFIARQEFLEFLRQNQLFCLQVIRLLSEDLHMLYHRFQTSNRIGSRGHKAKPLHAGERSKRRTS